MAFLLPIQLHQSTEGKNENEKYENVIALDACSECFKP